MCDLCKGFKDYEHSIKIHNSLKEKENLYQSQYPAVNEYEKRFKQSLANMAGKIMDEVVKEAFKIIKEKSYIKKALIMSVNEIDRLSKIVDKNVLDFVSKNISPNVLTDDEKAFLVKSGIDPKMLTREQLTVFDIAFKFGMYKTGNDKPAKEINLQTFEQYLKGNKFLPLDSREQSVLNSVKMDAAKYIKGLGNRWDDNIQTILIESDKAQRTKLEQTIYDKTKEAVINRETVQQFASNLGHATDLWSRDLIRNAQYLLHDAHEQGAAAEIERVYGKESKVYKYVYPRACKHCVRLFLTNGEGSKPKIFTVDYLRENGTNIGVKVADYKEVIGPVHPYCRCELVVLHNFQAWDEDKKEFVDKFEDPQAIRDRLKKRLEQRKNNLNKTT
jgi:hypothetical protein